MSVFVHSDSIGHLFVDLRCSQCRNWHGKSLYQYLPAATTTAVLLCESATAHRCYSHRQSLTCHFSCVPVLQLRGRRKQQKGKGREVNQKDIRSATLHWGLGFAVKVSY